MITKWWCVLRFFLEFLPFILAVGKIKKFPTARVINIRKQLLSITFRDFINPEVRKTYPKTTTSEFWHWQMLNHFTHFICSSYVSYKHIIQFYYMDMLHRLAINNQACNRDRWLCEPAPTLYDREIIFKTTPASQHTETHDTHPHTRLTTGLRMYW